MNGKPQAHLVECLYHETADASEAQRITRWATEFDQAFRRCDLDLCEALVSEVKKQSLCKSCLARVRLAEGELRHLQRAWGRAAACYQQGLNLVEDLAREAEQSLQGGGRTASPLERARLEQRVSAHQSMLAKCLHQISLLRLEQGHFQAAEEGFLRAAGLRESLGVPEDIAQSLIGLAQVYRVLGRYQECRALLDRILEITRPNENAPGGPSRAAAFHNLGLLHVQLGQFAAARQFFEDALKIGEKTGLHDQMSAARRELGQVYKIEGDYEKALQEYEAASAIDSSSHNLASRSATFHQIGMIYQDRGDYAEARQAYEGACGGWRELGDKIGEAQTKHQLGTLYQAQGAWEDARREYEQSLALAEEAGDRPGEVWTNYQLGLLYQDSGAFEPALACYQKSAVRAREIGDRIGEGRGLRSIGLLEQMAGHLEQARQHGEEALEILRQAGEWAEEAQCLHQLGVLDEQCADYSEARKHYEASLKLALSYGDKLLALPVLCQLTLLSIREDQPGEAQRRMNEALPLLDAVGQGGWPCAAHALCYLAGTLELQGAGSRSAAQHYYDIALDRARRFGDESLAARLQAHLLTLGNG